jgi:hypothetical protein
MMVEMEEMASRPFASVTVEIDRTKIFNIWMIGNRQKHLISG